MKGYAENYSSQSFEWESFERGDLRFNEERFSGGKGVCHKAVMG